MIKSSLARPPYPGCNPVLASFDDKFVFYIGRSEESKTDVYNIAQDTWTEGPTMADPESMMSACSLGDILYAFSG